MTKEQKKKLTSGPRDVADVSWAFFPLGLPPPPRLPSCLFHLPVASWFPSRSIWSTVAIPAVCGCTRSHPASSARGGGAGCPLGACVVPVSALVVVLMWRRCCTIDKT